MIITIGGVEYDSKHLTNSIKDGCDASPVIECLFNEILLRDAIMGGMVLCEHHNIKRNYMVESKYRAKMKKALNPL